MDALVSVLVLFLMKDRKPEQVIKNTLEGVLPGQCASNVVLFGGENLYRKRVDFLFLLMLNSLPQPCLCGVGTVSWETGYFGNI